MGEGYDCGIEFVHIVDLRVWRSRGDIRDQIGEADVVCVGIWPVYARKERSEVSEVCWSL